MGFFVQFFGWFISEFEGHFSQSFSAEIGNAFIEVHRLKLGAQNIDAFKPRALISFVVMSA